MSLNEFESIEDLRSEFDRLDNDKDGFITLKEFHAFYLEKNKDKSAVAQAFAELDVDNDGRVTFEEFQRAYKR